MAPGAKERALDAAISQIKKQFGDGALMRLGEATHMAVDSIPTGSLSVDLALGIGGVPRGRVSEIYGPESAGKTTLCQHIVAEAQKRGGLCAYTITRVGLHSRTFTCGGLRACSRQAAVISGLRDRCEFLARCDVCAARNGLRSPGHCV